MFKHIVALNWQRKRQNLLIALEMLFSFIVLFALVAVSLHFYRLYKTPLGFDEGNLWSITLNTGGRWQPENGQDLHQLISVLNQLPELNGVYTIGVQPFSMSNRSGISKIFGKSIFKEENSFSDGLAEAIDLKLLEGRFFSSQDDGQDWIPVIVNQRFADSFPGQDLVGSIHDDGFKIRVVGIFDDFRQHGDFSNSSPFMIMRQGRRFFYAPIIVVDVKSDVSIDFEERLNNLINAATPDWSFDIDRWSKLRADNNRIYFRALGIAAIIVGSLLTMVGFGLLGVLWQNVIRRTGEIGLRRAMGATAAAVRKQVVGEFLVLACCSIAIAAIFLVQLPLVGAIKALNWPLFLPAFLVAAGIFVCFCVMFTLYPSYQAARKYPADALRYE